MPNLTGGKKERRELREMRQRYKRNRTTTKLNK